MIAFSVLLLLSITGLYLNHIDLLSPATSSTSTPFAARITSMAIHPQDPTQVYLGTRDGVFHSKDSGRTFVKISLPYPAQNVVSIFFNHGALSLFIVLENGLILNATDPPYIWQRVLAPSDANMIVAADAQNGRLRLASREAIYQLDPMTHAWKKTSFTDKKNAADLIYDLHTGQAFPYLRLINDAGAVSLIILSITGLILFFKKKKKKAKNK